MTGPAPEVHWGGPDLPAGRLRDLLAERVRAVPPGGRIDWVTYYLRDRELADALVAARRRGVDVRVTVEGRPRCRRANRAALARLDGDAGLGTGLRVVGARERAPWRGLRPRLHEKLYAFSHPDPVALVGSFNPSGDPQEEEPDVIEEIRDQDRGHNVLVGLHDPVLVRGLVAHARRLHRAAHTPLARLVPASARRLRSDDTEVAFTPGPGRHPLLARLRRCAAGARVRVAASHLSGPSAQRTLAGLARRGARVEVVAEETPRRVPPALERALVRDGVAVARLRRPDGLPMHCKFARIDAPGAPPELVFGSFNWTERSLRLNREIVVGTRRRELVEAFDARWQRLWDEASGALSP